MFIKGLSKYTSSQDIVDLRMINFRKMTYFTIFMASNFIAYQCHENKSSLPHTSCNFLNIFSYQNSNITRQHLDYLLKFPSIAVFNCLPFVPKTKTTFSVTNLSTHDDSFKALKLR